MSTRTQKKSGRADHQQKKARAVLQGIVVTGGYPAAEKKTKMGRGYLHGIIHGEKHASRDLLIALEIIKPDKRPRSLNLRLDVDIAQAVIDELEFASDARVGAFRSRLRILLDKRRQTHANLS